MHGLLQDEDDSLGTQLLRGFQPMQSGFCSLFARKFSPAAAGRLRALASVYVSRVALWEAAHPELVAAAQVRWRCVRCRPVPLLLHVSTYSAARL